MNTSISCRGRPRIRVKPYHQDLASDRILPVSWAYLQLSRFTMLCPSSSKRRYSTGTLRLCKVRLTRFRESLKALRLIVQSFVSNRTEIAKRGAGPLVVTALRAWRAPRARPSAHSRRVGSRHRRRGASRVPQAASECSHVGLPSGYGHVPAARHHPE